MKKRLFSLMLAVFLCCSVLPVFAEETYTITVSASPEAYGNVSGGGTYERGATVKVSAIPVPGYGFTGWTENGVVVSTSPEYSFSAEKGRDLTAAFAVFTVTLDPGDGKGTPIVYVSTEQTEYKNWRETGLCEFYIEDNGQLAFKLEPSYVPDSFSPPDGDAIVFDKWPGNFRYNQLYSVNTTFKAKWKEDYDSIPDAAFSISPLSIALEEGGFTDVRFVIDELTLGKFKDDPEAPYRTARGLKLEFWGGMLKNEHEEKINIVCAGSEHVIDLFGGTNAFFYTQGEEADIAIYVDPDNYDELSPGTYSGQAWIDYAWIYGDYEYELDSIMINVTLTVPENRKHVLDGDKVVFYDENGSMIERAYEGQQIYVCCDNIPDGSYFTWTYLTDDAEITLEDNGDGVFTMPSHHVTVNAEFKEQEEYELRIAGNGAVTLPPSMAANLTGTDAYYWDEKTNSPVLDLNSDGIPDVLLDLNENTAQKLPGADLITESVTICFDTPVPYRYKSVTVVFAPAHASYTVRFIYDGTVISEQAVESGNAAQAPEVSDTPYGFFTGWDKAFDNVTEDTDINALFRYYGDVGNDGEADSSDAALILKFDAAMIDLTGDDLLCADADGNGEADSSDASLVLKYDSGSINGFRN